jgi:hypothetical protein
MRLLESETAGQFERDMKNHVPTAHRRAERPEGEVHKRRYLQFGEPFSR